MWQVDFCLAIPPHASAKLFECNSGAKTTDEQRFVWKATDSSGNGTLALAEGQFRSGQCLRLVDPATHVATGIGEAQGTAAPPGVVSLEFSLAMFLLACVPRCSKQTQNITAHT